LLAETQVDLVASESAPHFLLRRGSVFVDEKVVDPVQITVPGGIVMVKGDPQSGAECEVAEVGTTATVSVRRGMAEIQQQGPPVFLHAGQSARVEADPEGTQPVAGKINKVIPQGTIQKEGQIQELPLQLNAVINWNDLVQTLQTGRAQIQLVDGSTLNVGARSKIRVIKHDPQAQQTQIELALGRVEANVQKVTAPGGKFQLTTRSAVIGTIDTAFVAETDDRGTKVCGVEGTTQVQSSDPHITKTVRLHRKECTFVPFGGAPTDPVFDPGELAGLLNSTSIGEAGGIFGLGAAGSVALAAGLAGGAAAAILGIVLVTTGTTSPTAP
jgi:ferric-dicitrate binding protein FerR (iron transport regulator)